MQYEIENSPPPLSEKEQRRDPTADPHQARRMWDKIPNYSAIHPLSEPPMPEGGKLVPGSRFSEEQWERAAYMIAGGCPFIQVSKAVGMSRTTLWRAYHMAPDFRHRVFWERRNQTREAQARVRSLEYMVAIQLEKAVSRGEMKTVRWLADRLGVVARFGHDDDDPRGFREDFPPSDQTIAELAALPEEERPYGYHPYPPDAVMEPDWEPPYEDR
jgi:hypothetical protein